MRETGSMARGMRGALACAAALALARAAAAGFAIAWHTVDGGGGSSAGGAFAVSGTIGQCDAGTAMQGGAFAVVGGFWVWPVAVQTPGAPTLTIAAAAPGYATISWAPAMEGFVLQESEALTPADWSFSRSGDANPVTVELGTRTRFYRLFQITIAAEAP